MAAVLPPQTSSSTSVELSSTPSSSHEIEPSFLAPSNTPVVAKSPDLQQPKQRPLSYASKRLSTFSNTSAFTRSRPGSTLYPAFRSSLSYTLVRDFAYPPYHPLFYGPLPDQRSEASTPVSESHRRLSDPPPAWDTRGWSTNSWGYEDPLPPTSFGDGPPYSEDEDLHSPVVTTARHKKHKSADYETRGRSREARRGSYTGTNKDGSQTYYVSDPNEAANGPGGEYITYPPSSQPQLSALEIPQTESRRDSHFATLPNRTYTDEDGHIYMSDEEMSSDSSPDTRNHEGSRYSRDYSFTIASPEEEMHGKAVALFDFVQENDNELPLVEGQIILVSYRHGQGWLVAQDPRTGESGLVPEEYVRLLRDIEGGWNGLMNGQGNESNEGISPDSDAKTPTQTEHNRFPSGGGNGEYYTPVVSTFSTSSKDLEPYPTHLLGTQSTSRPSSSAAVNSPNSEVQDGTTDIKESEQDPRR